MHERTDTETIKANLILLKGEEEINLGREWFLTKEKSMLKDKVYNFIVRKNENVCYEYERYVKENLEEHFRHRIKHMILLMKLNWFYRIKKNTTPYLYWDRGNDYVGTFNYYDSNNVIKSDIQIIRNSTFFDGKWYLEKYPDIKGLDPAFHYLIYGWRQFRSPSPLFSTMLYLNRFDDAREMDINPILHFEKIAKDEKREASYKGLYNTVKKEIEIIERSIFWDESWYKEKNLKGEFYVESPAVHYFCLGCYQGMDPSSAFSQRLYEIFQPEVINRPYPHLLHFEQIGKYCRAGYFHQAVDYYNNKDTQCKILKDINEAIIEMFQSTRKRVLLISHLMNLTGAPKVLLKMAIILKNSGFFPVIATLHSGILDEECKKEDIPTVLFTEYEDGVLSEQIISFANLFDIILFNTVESLKMAHILRGTKAYKLCWLHEGNMTLDTVSPKQIRRLKYMNRVFTCAEYCIKFFEEYLSDEQIEVLHYGMDKEEILGSIVPSLEVEDKFVVTIVGTIGYRKGHDILMDSFEEMQEEVFGKIEFHIVGGILDSDVGERVREIANKNDNVFFHNLVSNEMAIQLISESSVLVVPSRDDPMPVVITEAMILKVPVLMSDTVGTAALVEDGINAFVLKENTPVELAVSLVSLYERRDEIKTIGIRGYEVYIKYLSDSSFKKRVIEIFNNTVMNERLTNTYIDNRVCLSDVEMLSEGIRLIFVCTESNILEIYSDGEYYEEEQYEQSDMQKVCLDKHLHKEGKRIALITIKKCKLNGFNGVIFSDFFDGIRMIYGEYVWSRLKKLSDDYGVCIQLQGNVIKFIQKNEFEKYIVQSPWINNGIKKLVKDIQNINKGSRPYNIYVETRENRNDNAYQLFRHDLMTNEFAYFIAPKTIIENETDEYVKAHYLLLNSERSKQYILRSKVIVCSWYQLQIYGPEKMAYLYPFINLNYVFVPHGISYDKDSYYLNKSIWGYFSTCIVASKYERKYFETVNGYSNVKVLGYPRMDKWTRSNINEKEIILFPTWRKEISQDYIQLLIEIVREIPDVYKIIYVAHPSVEDSDFRKICNLLIQESKNIICVSNKERELFNEYFASAKFLVTDYSSVAYDFAYKGGVALYYRPFMDLESSYTLFPEFYEHNCGFIVDDLKDLNKILLDSSVIRRIRRRTEDFYKYLDSNNTLRVFGFIKDNYK